MRVLVKVMSAVVCFLVVAGAAGCADTTPDGPDGPGTTTPTTAAADEQWVMPDLAGVTLQQAQDQIQQLTGNDLFLTTSHDLSGEEREQVLDDNWKVCTQNIAPGGAVTPDSVIDFGVVKTEESCP